MEDDDHDELLQCTDDESLSETDDQCLPVEKPEEQFDPHYLDVCKKHLVLVKFSLIIHTTAVLILFPPYIDSVAKVGNVYSILLTNTALCTCVMLFVNMICKVVPHDNPYPDIKLYSLPLKFRNLITLSLVYFLCGGLIIYALDRKRVLCHLQDPIKGIVVVFSLLYYFFFCRKLMGLQRIFSTTTIIVGLFIAVDYGLCNEFRCRGAERQHLSDDTGNWNWKVHVTWTVVYILGLAIFAAYFTLLERFLITHNETIIETVDIPATFISTVSQSVSYPNSNPSEPRPLGIYYLKKNSPEHLVLWMHGIGLIIIICMFWIEFVPNVGKTTNPIEIYNNTLQGILCHFNSNEKCITTNLVSWPFAFFYSLFAITAVKFLLASQSAVYTIATMASSLPFVGIWWSLVQFSSEDLRFVLTPSITGELICSLLSLPVVIIGLILLWRAHIEDHQWSRLASSNRPFQTHNT